MFDKIKNLTLAASVSALALASAAFADMPAVSSIDVEASYAAAEGTNAAEKFPEISADIRAAIAERVPTSADAADPVIRVDIRKIALDGAVMFDGDAEFNELEGVVEISSENGTLGDQAFPINIKATSAAQTAAPEGYILVPPSTEDFYQVMVGAFADNVAQGLDAVNTGGDEVSK